MKIEFNELKGFSKLFIDFINNDDFFINRFPNNYLQEFSDLTNKIDFNLEKREKVIEAIFKTNSSINLNNKQINNLELLKNETTFTVITGQQIGFLGGPLYTLLKTSTAVSEAIKLKNENINLNFIPIFWLEDNDHDITEATTAYYYNQNYSISKVSSLSEFDPKGKKITSFIKNDEYTINVINEIFDNINRTEYTNELKQFFLEIYSKEYQKDSFIALINNLFAEFGLLIVSANELRKTGVFSELVKIEINNPGKSNEFVLNANKDISNKNYQIQAKSNEYNLFYHEEDKRYKITNENIDNILSKNIDYSEFSPNVFLRTIFQDYTFPNVEYIAGPGEIAYWLQTKELFEYFNVNMSKIIPRISATLLTNRIQRNIQKSNKDIKYFFNDFNEIENELKLKFHNNSIDELINSSKIKLNDIFQELNSFAIEIDKSLESSIEGNKTKSIQLIEHIEKKLNTANNKKHIEEFNKYVELNSFVFPIRNYQERVMTLLNIINLIGFEKLNNLINRIIMLPNNWHNIINIDEN